MRPPAPPTYSLVVPAHNEEGVIEELAARLSDVMDKLDGEAEAILVDDGSRDRTHELMLEIAAADPRFRIVKLSRNFGHQIALTAGVDMAAGDAVIAMDADLQDPPEVVPKLVERWREGYDVVYGVRERRQGDTWFKRVTASLFYRVLHAFAETDVPVDAGDFRLVDRKVADAFRALPERHRYVRGLFAWLGFRQIGVPFARDERFAGEPKYSYRASLRLAIDGIVSFSTAPLRFALVFGFVVAIATFVVGIFALVTRIAGFYSLPGWASILVVVSFVGGVQLVLTSAVGLYVGRVYDEVKARPLYVVEDEPRTAT
jgi:dolichol-phosphate mannosyltransferase